MPFVKRFLEWMRKKEEVDARDGSHRVFFSEREVWMCHFGENVGRELCGKNEFFHRPVLVLRKINRDLFYGIPMSTKLKASPYYIEVNVNGIQQSAVIHQVRILDARRLHYCKGRLNDESFDLVKNTFVDLIIGKSDGKKITPSFEGEHSAFQHTVPKVYAVTDQSQAKIEQDKRT